MQCFTFPTVPLLYFALTRLALPQIVSCSTEMAYCVIHVKYKGQADIFFNCSGRELPLMIVDDYLRLESVKINKYVNVIVCATDTTIHLSN